MKKLMKDIPESDRPREKMIKKGPQVLSNLELAAVIVGSGNPRRDVLEIARDLKKLWEKEFDNLTIEKLERINGVAKSLACRIIAAIELSKRFLVKEEIKLDSAKSVVSLVEELRDKKQEYFLTFTIDGANNLIRKRTVFIGTLNQSLVHPREVFADAVADRAAGIILLHNHPSGKIEPSKEDFILTQRLLEAGRIMGIEVMDHIIVGKKNHFSFQKKGILKNL
ncbi:MAG: DNA repair protein RadC [Candidatus Aminicenantes bacterium]|jgi:DNA repair protein RadC|nr:DNA repair protein RadC [Candidatus Aminicenantes bacterium]